MDNCHYTYIIWWVGVATIVQSLLIALRIPPIVSLDGVSSSLLTTVDFCIADDSLGLNAELESDLNACSK